MSDSEMEKEIVEKGLVYPRVTNTEIEEKMLGVGYNCHLVPGTTTMAITATLPMAHINFTLCIESMACVDPRNFRQEIGEKYGTQKAAEAAKNKLWELEGYRLAYEVANAPKTAKERVVVELEELTARFGGLTAFLDSSSSESLPPEQHILLVKQKEVMADYIAILDKRLATWVDC